MNPSPDRRTFLESVSWTAATALTAGYTATATGYASNETIRIGCIGTGRRCRALMRALAVLPGVQIVAVCDVWDAALAEGRKLADKNAFVTKDHRALLDRKEVDAVVIGTPDHWHVPQTIDAMAAGKDVYVEKPLTHDLAEGKAILDAQAKYRKVVQVGTQQRSMPHIQKAYQLVRAGHIGRVHKVHLTWNRNTLRTQKPNLNIDPKTVDWKRFLGSAKDQPFDEYRFRQWRRFWDFGGGIFTDLMVHWIDVAHWFLDLDHPATAHSIGDWFLAKDVWETPDTVQTLLRYPDPQVQVHFEGTFVSNRNGAMIEFMGTEGTLYIDRGRYEVIPDRGKKLEPSALILGEGSKGLDSYNPPDGESLHLANWLASIRSRQQPSAPIEAGVRAAAAAHLANQALRSGQTAVWKS